MNNTSSNNGMEIYTYGDLTFKEKTYKRYQISQKNIVIKLK